MAYDQNTIHILCKRHLSLYPRGFRERLGESMEQTFDDLCNEQKEGPARRFVVLSPFAETSVGIVHEHLYLLREGDIMKTILANPRWAAIIGLILSLPLGLTFVGFMFDIESQGGQINTLGRIVIYGGLLLLPIAFALNLQSLLKREGPEGNRSLYTINLIIGAAILLLIIFTWGGLFLEEIYCLRGIRCD